MFTPVSKSGRRARAPKWWSSMLEYVPQVSIPALRPKAWTKELAEAWIDKIPSKCPFERQLWLGDRLVLYVPPLCPLNPISKQLYSIRIEAQAYLMEINTSA
jgi:hypothetical protein